MADKSHKEIRVIERREHNRKVRNARNRRHARIARNRRNARRINRKENRLRLLRKEESEDGFVASLVRDPKKAQAMNIYSGRQGKRKIRKMIDDGKMYKPYLSNKEARAVGQDNTRLSQIADKMKNDKIYPKSVFSGKPNDVEPLNSSDKSRVMGDFMYHQAFNHVISLEPELFKDANVMSGKVAKARLKKIDTDTKPYVLEQNKIYDRDGMLNNVPPKVISGAQEHAISHDKLNHINPYKTYEYRTVNGYQTMLKPISRKTAQNSVDNMFYRKARLVKQRNPVNNKIPSANDNRKDMKKMGISISELQKLTGRKDLTTLLSDKSYSRINKLLGVRTGSQLKDMNINYTSFDGYKVQRDHVYNMRSRAGGRISTISNHELQGRLRVAINDSLGRKINPNKVPSVAMTKKAMKRDGISDGMLRSIAKSPDLNETLSKDSYAKMAKLLGLRSGKDLKAHGAYYTGDEGTLIKAHRVYDLRGNHSLSQISNSRLKKRINNTVEVTSVPFKHRQDGFKYGSGNSLIARRTAEHRRKAKAKRGANRNRQNTPDFD